MADGGEGTGRPTAPPVEIDGYDTGEVLGRGAFGVVYRAVDRVLDRTVAIKVLTVAMDEEAERRFESERRSMGAVTGHPHIVNVFASGYDAMGRPYLVMDYMAGGSLADRLRDGGLGWEAAAQVGVKLAGALETAHRAGILHRDVKPENVLVSAYGEPTLGDFGISRVQGSYQTRSGFITATPLHAAPEVLSGSRASAASDVYSLASTVFTLAAGHPPFQPSADDEVPFALFYRVANDPVPDLRSTGAPESICAALEQGLAKDPSARPATAELFGRVLQDAQRAAGVEASDMRVLSDPSATVGGLAIPSGEASPTPTPGASPSSGVARVALTPPPGGLSMPADAVTVAPRRRRRALITAMSLVVLLIAGLVTVLVRDDGLARREDARSARTATTLPPSTEAPPAEALTTDTTAAIAAEESTTTTGSQPSSGRRSPGIDTTTTPTSMAPPVEREEPTAAPAPAEEAPAVAPAGGSPSSPAPAPAPGGDTGTTSSTTTTTDPSVYPNAQERTILAAVPSAVKGDGSACRRSVDSERPSGSTAGVTCSIAGAEKVVYAQYPSAAALTSYFDSRVEAVRGFASIDGRSCSSTSNSGLSSYQIDEATVGRLMCYPYSTGGGVTQTSGTTTLWFEWHHTPSRIYAFMNRGDSDQSAIWNAWNIAGPN